MTVTKQLIRVGHSPDPDDAFMFYALAKNLIPTEGYAFEHILQDIQTLNERATRGELDITAISFHAYPYVADQYALLPAGASMGDGYGPMLVARRLLSRSEIGGKRLAVPGTMTSAFLALQLWLEKRAAELDFIVVPFDQIFEAVRAGQSIVVRESSRANVQIKSSVESASGRGVPDWLVLDADNFTGKVQALPSREDVKLPVQEQLIVELYSR